MKNWFLVRRFGDKVPSLIVQPVFRAQRDRNGNSVLEGWIDKKKKKHAAYEDDQILFLEFDTDFENNPASDHFEF